MTINHNGTVPKLNGGPHTVDQIAESANVLDPIQETAGYKGKDLVAYELLQAAL